MEDTPSPHLDWTTGFLRILAAWTLLAAGACLVLGAGGLSQALARLQHGVSRMRDAR